MCACVCVCLLIKKLRQRGEWQDRGMGLRDRNYSIKYISRQDTLYNTGNYSHHFVITLNGVESIKIQNQSAIHLKLI